MSSKILLSAVAALAAVTTASAADLGKGKKAPPAPVVSPWEWTVGGGATTNYIFRGISQSNNQPSVNANAEIRYVINDNYTVYLGGAGSSVKLTNQDTSPPVEWDVIGGLRTTYGAFTVDLGAVGYLYSKVEKPNDIFVTTPNWFEGYAKTSFAVNDSLTLGVNLFMSPSYLDYGASSQYVAGTAAYKFGDFAVSGEVGRQFFGKTDAAHTPLTGNRSMPDYNYWNVGGSYSYKIATLDLRYHDTSLSQKSCADITGPTNGIYSAPSQAGRSKYCGAAFVGTLSFALTSKDVK
jgi:uncharacterized protein (TIGR02001 family)